MKTFFRLVYQTAFGLVVSLSGVKAEEAGGFVEPGQAGLSNFQLGFNSEPYLINQGIWAALLITTSQAESLMEAWSRGPGSVVIADQANISPEERRELGVLTKNFQLERDQILTPEQAELRTRLNQVGKEVMETNMVDGRRLNVKDPVIQAAFAEQLKGVLTPQQLERVESAGGSRPDDPTN